MPKTARPSPKRKKAQATAPGQLLGYGLQYTRLTAMLLDAPEGSVCSLEVLDDTATSHADGTTKVSQSKSSLTDNPVADRAVSLWKAIANWVKLVQDGRVNPSNTIFELYISRSVDGAIISSFHNAASLSDAKRAIQSAKDELWGTAPAFAKKAQIAETVTPHLAGVFAADENVLLPIIVGLRKLCGSGSPQSDIETAIRRHPVSQIRVVDIANQMCGWVKREADKLLEKSQPAWISRDAFHTEYASYVRRVDREMILKSWSPNPSENQKTERLYDIFVRQLDLIELDYDDKLEAISDFLRASTDRAKWSQTGEVHEQSFADLDDNLTRVWKNHNRAAEVEAAAKPDMQRGRLLHSKCMIHQTRVQGMEPPSHFVPGCFHALADGKVIGWHPEYKTLLRDPKAGNQ